jgi:hypothetical protein
VVVSVKGQVGALVFWVLGERERIKKWEGKCFFFPCSMRVQGKKKAYGAVQNGTVCFLFFFLCAVKRMKWRRFDQNALFHLNENWRQKEFNFKSALYFARFFTMVLGFGFLQSSP